MLSLIPATVLLGLLTGAVAHPRKSHGTSDGVEPVTTIFASSGAASMATVTVTVTTTSQYPYVDDSMPFPSYSALPDDIDMFEAYKKVVASTKNETIAWWYEGLSSVIPEGLPETPGLKSETLQAWRLQHLNETTMRADWHELIILGDFQSCEDATFFHQAETGTNNTGLPNYYYDGPVTYYITKNPNNTLSLQIHQPNTTILISTIKATLYNNQVQFWQTERKQKTAGPYTSTLRFISSLDDVRNPNVTSAKGSGYYHYTQEGTIANFFAYPNGTYGTTHILGNIQKQGINNEGWFPRQWETMTREFPEWFNEAGQIDPDWTAVLTKAGLEP